ncbi:MAG: DUF927 domain-containing protein [Rhizobiales bacterium]|nr:DUF927 domain-containing protein [Hyphomicrobiales bacterium]
MLLLAFAAPLLKLANWQGCTVNALGESGVGKSTMAEFMCSVPAARRARGWAATTPTWPACSAWAPTTTCRCTWTRLRPSSRSRCAISCTRYPPARTGRRCAPTTRCGPAPSG